MEYQEIVKALRDYSELVEAASQKYTVLTVMPDRTDGKFEDVVCAYVDALAEIKRIRNINKRSCLAYSAMGFFQWQIAEKLHIGQQAVSKNIQWCKRFFSDRA